MAADRSAPLAQRLHGSDSATWRAPLIPDARAASRKHYTANAKFCLVQSTGMRKTPPDWFDDEGLVRRARRFLGALNRLPKDHPARAQLDAYGEFAAIKLIFESNSIEGAGLNETETRKLLKSHIPSIPSEFGAFIHRKHTAQDPLSLSPQLVALIKQRDWGLDVVEFSYKERRRPALEVWFHRIAYLHLISKTLEFVAQRIGWWLVKHASREQLKEKLGINADTLPTEPPALFSEQLVREVHAQLLSGPLAKEATPYRGDNAFAGTHLFVAPELLASAMKEFVRASNHLLAHEKDPFTAAAQISHRFVSIHPFEDMNGRMSRLLMTAILTTYGMPFPVPVRGGKKSKARYMWALRKADRGNIDPLRRLIAMSALECFEDVDTKIKLLGQPGLLTKQRNTGGSRRAGTKVMPGSRRSTRSVTRKKLLPGRKRLT